VAVRQRDDWWSWSAKELRWLIADPDQRGDWDAARTVLPVARAYEARLRRLSRAVGLNGAVASLMRRRVRLPVSPPRRAW
jgi:hypothetical protein